MDTENKDRSLAHALIRMLLHTLFFILWSFIPYVAIIGPMSGIQDHSRDPHALLIAYIFLGCVGGITGLIAGYKGPIGVKRKKARKIMKAKPIALYIGCILYIILAGLVYVSFPSRLEISIPFVAYSLLFAVGSMFKIKACTCKKCKHVNCFVKKNEYYNLNETKIQTRTRNYSGTSYDVYSSDGSHIGTARGPSTSGTERREVKKETWTVYYECVHCKNLIKKENHTTTYGEWHF